MYKDYLEQIEHITVKERVSKNIEVSEYLIKNIGTPVYFENLDGYKAVGNMWARRTNFAKILKIDEKDLKLKMLQAIENPKPVKIVENAPFMTETTDFSLKNLPIPKYFKDDGSNYITSGIVFSELDGKRNVSYHRMMILDERHAAVRLVPRHLYQMYNTAIERGEELRFAMVIGADPSFLLAAATSVDYNIDESEIASALDYYCLGRSAEMVRLKSGLIVPVNSEYVLEGRFTKAVKDVEGPFLDIMRTYDVKENQPIVEFERLYKTENSIFHLLLPGGYEHYNLMGLPREPTIYKEIKDANINVIDLKLTNGGSNWLHCVIKIKKENEDDGLKTLNAAFKGHKSLKHAVVVDEDIDINNLEEIEWAIATRVQADRDMITFKERGSSLDPSRYENDITTKVGIDATMPLKERGKYRKLF
ncbi:MAG: UbiD family decarboxylase [Thermoplasmata archaeon]